MPAPYDYTIAPPIDAFQRSLALFSGLSEQQRQEEERAAQEARRERIGAALASLKTDRSPENVADVLLTFPELKEQITASQEVLDDAGKKADIDFKTRLYTMQKGGRHAEALAMLEERATALKNTPGKEQEAKATEDLIKAWKIDPSIGEETLALQIAATAPDLYKAMHGADGPLDKGYALNVQLFGKAQADAWRAGEEAKKGVITATGPTGMQYMPALSVSPMLAGATAAAPPGAPTAKITAEMYQGAINGLGAEKAAEWLLRNGMAVEIKTPREYALLPDGAPYERDGVRYVKGR